MPKVRRQRRASDGPYLVLALVMLIFVAAASLSDGRLLPDRAPRPAQQSASGDHTIMTGSLLIAPPAGNVCEHRLIDNETWQIRPAGFVACDEAVSWNAKQRDGASTGSRLEAIRDAFNPKR